MIVAGYGLSLSNPHLDARGRIVGFTFVPVMRTSITMNSRVVTYPGYSGPATPLGPTLRRDV